MSNVLFVDDDPLVLEGLRDGLRSQRKRWRMAFAEGGEAALEILAREPVEVVVSDMQMPGMDGAAFLAEVQIRHPGVVRIVLTGQARRDAELRVVPVAHLVLAKPCDPVALRAAVERAAALRTLLTDERLRATIHQIGVLPSPPGVLGAMQAALADSESSLAEVARVVETDVAVAAKVLQLVNSGFFGLARRVSRVADAVAFLGLETLSALVVSAAVVHEFVPGGALPGFSLEALERHSVAVAGLAAAIVPRALAGDAATAGTLHDIGKLLLAARAPERLAEALALAEAEERPLHAIEVERYGASHASLGGYLLALWGLPIEVVEAVTAHHDPAAASEEALVVTAAVHVADHLVHEAPGDPDAAALAALGGAERLEEWRARARETREERG